MPAPSSGDDALGGNKKRDREDMDAGKRSYNLKCLPK